LGEEHVSHQIRVHVTMTVIVRIMISMGIIIRTITIITTTTISNAAAAAISHMGRRVGGVDRGRVHVGCHVPACMTHADMSHHARTAARQVVARRTIRPGNVGPQHPQSIHRL